MEPYTIYSQATTNGKLRLFSLYVDFPASVCARWLGCLIAKLAGPHWQTIPEIWKIDSLKASKPIRQMMTNDAANADVIIISTSSLAPPELALIEWLDSLAAWKTNGSNSGLLIGLLGDEASRAVELDGTVKPLIRCAQHTGRDFIWHWMGEKATHNDSEWLTENIQNLLTRKLAVKKEAVLPEMAVDHL